MFQKELGKHMTHQYFGESKESKLGGNFDQTSFENESKNGVYIELDLSSMFG